MKIAFISVGELPIPVTVGGAVESLIGNFIDQNEIEKEFNITVYSKYDKVAIKRIDKYKKTNFNFIKCSKIGNKLYFYYARIFNKLLNLNLSLRGNYLNKILKNLKNKNYDAIIIENDITFVKPIKEISEGKSKIYLHLHNDYLNKNTKNYKEVIDNCDGIIGVSNFIKNRVLTCKDVNKNSVQVLMNCSDVKRFDIDISNSEIDILRKKYGINKNDVIIMFTGRLSREKGVDYLIKAFKEIKRDNIKLMIVGSTWFGSENATEFSTELVDLAKEIKEKVIFTGYIEPNSINKIYKLSDICVVPSIWEEPAGLVVIEAMAAGKALLLTNSGGISEYADSNCSIVVDKEKSLETNLKTKLELLIDDVELRNSLGKKGKERSKEFNIENYYKNFSQILRNR
ncbi:glycosyltransferase family 4 protein [Clostridium perfringens]|uniref:glycosyltransferase family 4 protein n=1 Tax=Clostridium perfringens TaxID=1502 RepID=UPI0018E414BE|nr:glycosyltransferase family 4 protein [Clostridium perfringens]MBI6036998.1 glycosyltransferase family 4 protein [Clostridium perfringens]MDK0598016.1 glycosyltransferase family 4 protein [Clostridium perfringens]MDK0945221.1 glycosyltransferase family 4 protein [Clostridium perfringens]MDK0962006.1 glycosyltransferase family 4 protein [Clostridium perfringens]MDK0964980.1 glycosyltransferase family 4 protein [Clostridium perfringens]